MARRFKVGQWTVAPDLNSLERDGRTVRVEPKVMQVLLTLAEQPGEVVTKEQLIHRVWAETFVTDDVLTRSVSELRKAFEDNAREPTYIQTVARGGYRILAPVVAEATDQRAARRQYKTWQITLTAVAILAIAAAISVAYYRWRAKVRPATVMLAALPFENLSGDPEQEYFSDGLTDEMTNRLGRLQPKQLRVIGLADSYSLFSRYGMLPPREAYPKAKAAALMALQIDDQLAEAHATLGEIKASYDWDWATAEREFKRALELNSGSPMPHYWYSYSYLTPMGRHAEAVAEMKRALELDPLSLMTSTNLAGRFLSSRQYDQAIEQLQKTLELDPDFGPAHGIRRANWRARR